MHVGIWHLSRKPLDGRLVRCAPAGGPETAVVHTAEELVRHGARVTVYCNTPAACEEQGVAYRPAGAFPMEAPRVPFDAFLVVRHLAALTVPVRTRVLVYWTHDNLDQPFLHGMLRFFEERRGRQRMVGCLHLGELMDHLDGVFAVSRWQADAIAGRLGVERERIHVVGNGLAPDAFSPDVDLTGREPIVMYSLPPDRAFLPLLEIFPLLRARHPRVELHLYSRSTIYGATRAEDEASYGELYAGARRMPGVHHHDPVDRPTLARAMERAMVYAYPTAVAETYCIPLLEAQAAGLVPIATPCGAIPERIENGADGFLVPGDPNDPVFHRRFAERVLRVLDDERLRLDVAGRALRRAHDGGNSWKEVAARMLAVLEPLAARRQVRTVRFDLDRVGPYRTSPTSADAAPARTVLPEELVTLGRRFRELLQLAG